MKHGSYGIIAEFDTPEGILSAARRAYADGYTRMDAYTPYPVDGLSEVTGLHSTRVPLIVFIGGLLGGLGGYLLQYYINVISFPLNIGGRPLNSWPAFIPVTFECTILGAALAAFFGMFALNGLPMPYHPVFNSHRFQMASRDRFFLCIKASDEQFDKEKTKEFLRSLQAANVDEVAY